MFTTYKQATDFLFAQLPAFHNIGAGAYKPGLDTIISFCSLLGDPHKAFPSIHIAGTNGKGSTAHSLASVMQAHGLKTGLFTSPHLVDFRERIRINGEMISHREVIDFLNRTLEAQSRLRPSFFELTTAMAFDHFARHNVDIAVIETGLGGRLDSTNILQPILSVITNISLDHTELLGDTLPKIAAEKAGIIKKGTPVVIGEGGDEAVRRVFIDKARQEGAPLTFACDRLPYASFQDRGDTLVYAGTPFGDICSDLTGSCQPANMATILTALQVLKKTGVKIANEDARRGLSNVCNSTGLMGRWMFISHQPDVIADTGHNEGCWQYLAARFAEIPRLTAVLGWCEDKDIEAIIKMLPANAQYIFTAASTRRAMPAARLAAMVQNIRPDISAIRVVEKASDACALALKEADSNDTVFIGGSTFVVADYLKTIVKDEETAI